MGSKPLPYLYCVVMVLRYIDRSVKSYHLTAIITNKLNTLTRNNNLLVLYTTISDCNNIQHLYMLSYEAAPAHLKRSILVTYIITMKIKLLTLIVFTQKLNVKNKTFTI